MRALVVVFFLSLFALGCGDDVGACSDEVRARVPVTSGGQVMYGGQAIVNKSCAGGRCHSSTAKGDLRSGAPAGLDFDLVPVRQSDADGDDVNEEGDTYVILTPAQLAGLRSRQQTVYDRRATIWQLVKEFRMPPPAKEFTTFRQLKSIVGLGDDDDVCTKGKAYKSLLDGESQEVLRNWLACGAPIVESNGSVVEKVETKGRAGWQYPVCEEAPGEGGISLDGLMAGALSTCSNCHPGTAAPDLSSTASAYRALLATAEVCEGKPYVTKGDPDKSFLYDLISKDDPGCDIPRMPLTGPLSDAEIAQVAAWITAGAPKTDADLPATSSEASAGGGSD